MTLPGDSAEWRRKWFRLSLSLLAAAGLLYLLLRGVDWSTAWQRLRLLSPWTWLLALGIHASIYVLRTLRFAALIPDRRVPFGHLWSIQSANQMASLLLPMRTGEITYPIYLRNAGVPLEVGVAGLVVSRSLDLLAVLTITVFSAIFLGSPIDSMPLGSGIPVILMIAVAAAGLIAVATGGAPFIRAIAAILARFGAGLRILGRVEQVARGFETVGRYRAVAEAFTLTLFIWVGVDLFYWVLMRGMGFDQMGPVDIAFGASAAILTNLLPINTFAGIGTQEWGWTWGFEHLGIGRSEAAASALAVHAAQLINVGILGLIAQFQLSAKPRKEQTRVLAKLARSRALLLETVARVPPAAAELRPAPERWSVAEIVDHLAAAEESIALQMHTVLEKPGDVPAGRRVRLPLAASLLRLRFLRFRAPPHSRPREGVSLAAALARFETSHGEIQTGIVAAEDFVLRGKRFPHRVFGALDILEWGHLISYHERRHSGQIRETARLAAAGNVGSGEIRGA